MSRSITARAPGKLIISGEHAVVYGKPAIAVAVDRYANTTISPQNPIAIFFDFLNLKYKGAHNLKTLRELKHRLEQDYLAYKKGEISIREVLKHPFELLKYSTTHLLSELNLSLSQGINIHTQSTIPIGCGMGSSAATVVSINHALSHFHQRTLTTEEHLNFGIHAENLQHGTSSGLDLQVAIRGGCLYLENGSIESRPLPQFKFQIINTGTPESSTGECVEHASKYFKDAAIADEFESATKMIDKALFNNNHSQFKEGIIKNQQLLTAIGVVPQRIQDFVALLEENGIASKICGAGSIRGNSAGILLVLSSEDINSLAESYQYSAETLNFEPEGVKIV